MVHAVLLPASTRSALDSNDLSQKNILLSISTDIALDGCKCEEWLIATDEHLSVISPRKAATPNRSSLNAATPSTALRDSVLDSSDAVVVLRSIQWNDIDEFRNVTGVGSGRLQIRQGDQWTDLLRYSNALTQRFHKVTRQSMVDRILTNNGKPVGAATVASDF